MLLSIQKLHVQIGGTTILHGVDLEISTGEIHVIMGPNGAGKSSLARTLAGHSSCEVIGGSVVWDDSIALLDLPPDERAQLGLFVSFQNPPEIPGVPLQTFLQKSYSSIQEKRKLKEISEDLFLQKTKNCMTELGLPLCFLKRCLNEGFSGGEKKRCEILQMFTLQPLLAILDEIDSGLDLDSLSSVVKCIGSLRKTGLSAVIITHYPKLARLLEPTAVHMLCDGRIIRSGDVSLATEIDRDGYRYEKVSSDILSD